MGYVQIPAQVQAGSTRVAIDLTSDELQQTIDKLKAVLEKVTAVSAVRASSKPFVATTSKLADDTIVSSLSLEDGSSSLSRVGTSAASAASTNQKSASDIADQFLMRQKGLVVSSSDVRSSPSDELSSENSYAVHFSITPPAPTPPLPTVRSSIAPPFPTVPALATFPASLPLPGLSVPPPEIPLAAPSQPAVTPPNREVPAGSLTLSRHTDSSTPWRTSWLTASSEHNRESVHALKYTPQLEGLMSGGDGHGGWLVSASKSVLNLWECSLGGGGGSDAPLQVMHSQSVQYAVDSMDVDSGAKLLVAAAWLPNNTVSLVAHSLHADSFFAYKGMIRLPATVQPGPRKPPGGPRLCHVTSLQPLGGPLQTCVMATAGADAFVYDVNAFTTTGTIPPPPKATWKAHSQPITCLHRSPVSNAVVTGGSEGTLKMWDLKKRPTTPARQFTHRAAVTAVTTLGENVLASCSADGVLNLWDVRGGTGGVAGPATVHTAQAMMTIVPDGKPVVTMAVNLERNTLAVATTKGLYCLELEGGSAVLSPLVPLPPSGPCLDMKWSDRNGQLYAGIADGTIAMYRRRQG